MLLHHITSLAFVAVGVSATAIPDVFKRSCSNAPQSCACGNAGCFDCAYEDVVNMANYFIAAGQVLKTVGGGFGTKLGQINNCVLIGYTTDASCTTSSYTQDIGYGIQSYIQNVCCAGQSYCHGEATAGGNGNFGLILNTVNG